MLLYINNERYTSSVMFLNYKKELALVNLLGLFWMNLETTAWCFIPTCNGKAGFFSPAALIGTSDLLLLSTAMAAEAHG